MRRARANVMRVQFDDPQTFTIIGAAMAVHAELGHGFLETVYREAMALELGARNVPFTLEARLPVHYKGQRLQSIYRVDFVCFDTVLVEVKALDGLGRTEESQVINYLRAARRERALLFNFGASSLQHRRIVWELPAAHDPLIRR